MLTASRSRLFAAVLLMGAAPSCTAPEDSTGDQKAIASPSSSVSPSVSPTATASASESTRACVSSPPGQIESGGPVAALYFYCLFDVVPVRFRVPEDAKTPLWAVVRAFVDGPNKAQRTDGYIGGVHPKLKFDLTVESGSVQIDFDADSVDPDRWLLNSFPWRKPLERTVRDYSGLELNSITIDGVDLCVYSPECASEGS